MSSFREINCHKFCFGKIKVQHLSDFPVEIVKKLEFREKLRVGDPNLGVTGVRMVFKSMRSVRE